MIEKPLEWRRFERVELEGQVARTAPRPTASPVFTTPSLLQEFERVLRENERLQMEVNTLRAEALRNNGRAPKFREELESARIELARIEGAPDVPHSAASPRPDTSPNDDTPSAAVGTEQLSLPDLARIVAGYIFSTPTDAKVRLVEDALRGRGVL